MKLIYAAWNYWGPGCTLVVFIVAYASYITHLMRKEDRAIEAESAAAYQAWRESCR